MGQPSEPGLTCYEVTVEQSCERRIDAAKRDLAEKVLAAVDHYATHLVLQDLFADEGIELTTPQQQKEHRESK